MSGNPPGGDEHRSDEHGGEGDAGDRDSVDRMLDKLRGFVATLEPEERAALAALIGPGVALAYRDDDEVEGFGTSWSPRRLPDSLAARLRDRGIEVTGLDQC